MQRTQPGHTAPAPGRRALRTLAGGLATGAIAALLFGLVLPWAFRLVGAALPGEGGGWGRWLVVVLVGLWLARAVAGFSRHYARQLARYADLDANPYAATIRRVAVRSVALTWLIEGAVVAVALVALALALRAWGRW